MKRIRLCGEKLLRINRLNSLIQITNAHPAPANSSLALLPDPPCIDRLGSRAGFPRKEERKSGKFTTGPRGRLWHKPLPR